jgi:hypothetical protein
VQAVSRRALRYAAQISLCALARRALKSGRWRALRLAMLLRPNPAGLRLVHDAALSAAASASTVSRALATAARTADSAGGEPTPFSRYEIVQPKTPAKRVAICPLTSGSLGARSMIPGYDGERSARRASSRWDIPPASPRKIISLDASAFMGTKVITDYPSGQERIVSRVTMLTVSAAKQRKRPRAMPLANPPPPGTIWARIDEERMALNWSARHLDDVAGVTPGHFTLISTRGNWSEIQANVRDKFIAALVKAGADPQRFDAKEFAAPALPTARQRTVELDGARDTQSMVEAAAQLLNELDGVPVPKALELLFGVKLQHPSVEGYYRAARLRMSPKMHDAPIITEEFGEQPARKARKRS